MKFENLISLPLLKKLLPSVLFKSNDYQLSHLILWWAFLIISWYWRWVVRTKPLRLVWSILLQQWRNAMSTTWGNAQKISSTSSTFSSLCSPVTLGTFPFQGGLPPQWPFCLIISWMLCATMDLYLMTPSPSCGSMTGRYLYKDASTPHRQL